MQGHSCPKPWNNELSTNAKRMKKQNDAFISASNTILIDMENLSAHVIQQAFYEEFLHSLGKDHINEINNWFGSKIPINSVIIANHRAKQLSDLFSYRDIAKQKGPLVSQLLWITGDHFSNDGRRPGSTYSDQHLKKIWTFKILIGYKSCNVICNENGSGLAAAIVLAAQNSNEKSKGQAHPQVAVTVPVVSSWIIP